MQKEFLNDTEDDTGDMDTADISTTGPHQLVTRTANYY